MWNLNQLFGICPLDTLACPSMKGAQHEDLAATRLNCFDVHCLSRLIWLQVQQTSAQTTTTEVEMDLTTFEVGLSVDIDRHLHFFGGLRESHQKFLTHPHLCGKATSVQGLVAWALPLPTQPIKSV